MLPSTGGRRNFVWDVSLWDVHFCQLLDRTASVADAGLFKAELPRGLNVDSHQAKQARLLGAAAWESAAGALSRADRERGPALGSLCNLGRPLTLCLSRPDVKWEY